MVRNSSNWSTLSTVGAQSRRRWNRRWLLKGAALSSGLTATVLLGCGREQKPAAPAVTQQPKQGGTLTLRAALEVQGRPLDLHTSTPRAAQQLLLWAQGLVYYDLDTYEVQPQLAQRWEQPSEAELVFGLQPNVKFHNKPPANGRLMTAQDVVFSLERIRTDDPRFVNRSLLIAVDKIEALDQGRVRLTMKEPDAALLSKLATEPMAVLAPEVVEKAQKFSTAEELVGTGAFIITRHEENVGQEFVRNPDYWKPGLPYLDRIRSRYFANLEIAWATFQAGQIDILVQVPGSDVKKYLAQQGPGYTPLWGAGNDMTVLYPNTKRHPMDDPRVTKALRLLIDHEEFITAWAEREFGRGRNAFLFPASLHLWDLSHEEYYKFLYWKQPKDQAVQEALALLSAAGYNRDNPLRFQLICRDADYGLSGGELTHAQWRRLSQGVVQPELRPIDSPTQERARASREFTYAYLGFQGGVIDPDIPLTQNYKTGSVRNYTGFSDAKADDLIDRQRRAFNLAERRAIVRELILHLIDRYPGSFPTAHYVLNATKPYIRGFQAEHAHYHGKQYERVWLDT